MHNMWWFVFYAAVVNNEITDRCLQAGSSSVLIAFTAFIAPLRFFNTRHAIKFSPPYHRWLKPVCSCEMKPRSIFSWAMSLSLLRLLFKQIRFSNISLCADATHASCVCSVAFLTFLSCTIIFTPLGSIRRLIDVNGVRKRFVWRSASIYVECFRKEFNWLLCKHDLPLFFRVNFHWILQNTIFAKPINSLTMSIRSDFWHAQQRAPRDEWVIQLICLLASGESQSRNGTWKWLSSDDWLLKSRWDSCLRRYETYIRWVFLT